MMHRKKLLFVHPQQFGYGAGYYYYCKYLKNFFEIDFICYDEGLNKIHEEGVKVIYRNRKGNKFLRLFKFIWFIIKYSCDNDFDNIFCFQLKFVFLIGLFDKSKNKILDIRTGSLNNNPYLRWIINKLIFFNTIFFQKVTVLAEGLRKSIGIPDEKTTLLPLGADTIDISEKKFNKMNLIYVGVFYKRNLEVTIKGFQKFYNKYGKQIDIHYDIIGFYRSKDEKRIKECINSFEKDNGTGIINYCGPKNHTELIKYFRNATVGVCFVPKTPYYDLQPSTKILEYALSGLITIATNTNENKRLMTDENGVICEDNAESFFKGLEKIYISINKYDYKIIKNSLSNYSWEKITKNILLPLLIN